MRQSVKALLTATVLLMLAAVASAQDAPATTPDPNAPMVDPAVPMMGAEIAAGLSAPRHVFYGSDGTLYIAEAGEGGELTATNATGQGEVFVGFTARVSTVSPDGEQDVLIDGLFSLTDMFGGLEGVSAVYVDDAFVWLVMGQGPTRDTLPEGAYASALVQLDRETLEIVNTVDLLAFEETNNPDGTADIASNPQDIAVADDGTIYLVDASGNSLLRYTEAGGLELFAAWEVIDTEPSPVPTSVVIAPDGTFYVGFLSGFPFLPGTARIEHLSAEGELLDTIEGLTLVVDVEIGQDGNLYAVQFADGFGEMGYNPNSGSVIMIDAEGVVTPVVEGLNFPYGIAQADDGAWAVTVNAAFSEPTSGVVIEIPAM